VELKWLSRIALSNRDPSASFQRVPTRRSRLCFIAEDVVAPCRKERLKYRLPIWEYGNVPAGRCGSDAQIIADNANQSPHD